MNKRGVIPIRHPTKMHIDLEIAITHDTNGNSHCSLVNSGALTNFKANDSM